MALNINIYRNAHYIVNNLAKTIYRQAMEEQLAGLCFDYAIDLEFTLYKPSKRKIDRSNILCIVEKYFCDALVHYGCIGDDNDLYINSTKYLTGGVDKRSPRAEILIWQRKL